MSRLSGIFYISIIIIITLFRAVPVYSQKQQIPSQESENFKALLSEADIIAVGRVVSIVDAPVDLLRSEHNPEWKIATFEVIRIQLGLASKGNKVQVIFANGTFAVWERYPKLNNNQEYILILRDLSGLVGEYLRKQPVEKGQYYIVQDPQSVQNKIKLEQIKKLIH